MLFFFKVTNQNKPDSPSETWGLSQQYKFWVYWGLYLCSMSTPYAECLHCPKYSLNFNFETKESTLNYIYPVDDQ